MKTYQAFKVILVPFLFFSCIGKGNKNGAEMKNDLVIYDCHVHIMSPELINDWKDLGIPFSKANYYYSDIDSILTVNKSDNINLIGMGYVYGNPEFYQGNEAYEKLKKENDYLFKTSHKFKQRVKPYFTVDPLKEYAIEEINRCIKINRNSGLKLHFNASQVYLTEPDHLSKIKPIFEIAAENNIPILLHFDNGHPKFGKPDVDILIDSVLVDLKPIHLTIAHFGTSGGFSQKTKNVINRFSELYEKDKISKRHNILFDISAVALDKDSEGVKKLTEEEFQELKKNCSKIGYEKIIFGTEYPLYTSNDYIQILKEKLDLTESELNKIINKNTVANRVDGREF